MSELGEGYHFVTARVEGGALPADTVRAGRRCAASLPPPPPPLPPLPPRRRRRCHRHRHRR